MDATGRGGRDSDGSREPAYIICQHNSIYMLKRWRGLLQYSTIRAAVCRAVGGNLVAAIPPLCIRIRRCHGTSLDCDQNEFRCSVATRCPQPYSVCYSNLTVAASRHMHSLHMSSRCCQGRRQGIAYWHCNCWQLPLAPYYYIIGTGAAIIGIAIDSVSHCPCCHRHWHSMAVAKSHQLQPPTRHI